MRSERQWPEPPLRRKMLAENLGERSLRDTRERAVDGLQLLIGALLRLLVVALQVQVDIPANAEVHGQTLGC